MIKNLRPKLVECGKIKIGNLGELRQTKNKEGTYRLPKKLDHFLITTTERDDTGNFIHNTSLMKEVAEVVNEPAGHLTTIPIYLLFDDIDSNFYTCYNCYQGKTRICTGDGEKAVILKTGEEITCPCPRLAPEYDGKTPCKPYGRLNIILQTMDIIGGVWVYRTTGWNSVQDILGSLLIVKRQAGKLSGIPLVMKLFPKTVQRPHGPVTVYTVSLLYRGSFLALAEEAKQRPMIAHDDNLVPDQTIETGEEEEIQEEFFPPETETERAGVDAETVAKGVSFPSHKEMKESVEGKEPTAADLAKKAKQKIEDTKRKSQERAATARKKAEVAAAVAAAEASKKEATKTTDAEQQTEEPPPGEAPPDEEGKVGEPASEPEFGWV